MGRTRRYARSVQHGGSKESERKFLPTSFSVTQKKKERKEGHCGRTYVAGTHRGVTVGLCDLVAVGSCVTSGTVRMCVRLYRTYFTTLSMDVL